METRLLKETDIDAFVEHVSRHIAESGQGSTPIFAPYSSCNSWNKESKRNSILNRWSKSLNEAGWERAWAVYDGTQIIGHIDLKSRDLETCIHRAVIGIGIEESHRRRGIGQHLMKSGIAWAKQRPSLAWLDLNVFAHNEAAIRLYQKLGFIEVGRINEMFRVDGQSIDDIQMVLKLR